MPFQGCDKIIAKVAHFLYISLGEGETNSTKILASNSLPMRKNFSEEKNCLNCISSGSNFYDKILI